MKTLKVVVVDYGMGNLLSVSRALEHCGAMVIISSNPAQIASAEYLILPGVGAFADGMSELKQRGLIEPIKSFIDSGRPFLGICLGMQLMFDVSEEFGECAGLGIIAGKVISIPDTTDDGRPHKIPHIGWNRLFKSHESRNWENTICAGIPEGAFVYFIHSYTAVPESDDVRLADSFYNGRRISAIVRSGNTYGCQFHPEKSGKVGLGIISRFLLLSE